MMIRRKGFTLIELLVVVAIIALLIAILLPSLAKAREQAKRSTCASNMKQVYTAMYEYSGDNKGMFPKVSGGKGMFDLTTQDDPTTLANPGMINVKDYAEDPVLRATEAGQSYTGTFDDGDNGYIAANLWLLVRGDFAEPNIFRCPSDPGGKNWSFDMEDLSGTSGGVGPQYFLGFPFKGYTDGTATNKELSYSFINPWADYSWMPAPVGPGIRSDLPWGPDTDARIVLAADQNNGPDPTANTSSTPPNYGEMKSNVNSKNHQQEGQNVMFGDGHITFNRSAYVGLNGDNIYTSRFGTTTLPEDTAGDLYVNPKIIKKSAVSEDWDTVLIPSHWSSLEGWTTKQVIRRP